MAAERRQSAVRPGLSAVVLQRRALWARPPAWPCLHDQDRPGQDLQLPRATDWMEMLRLPLHSVTTRISFLVYE